MATLLSSLESQARLRLKEVSASYWSSAELIDICNHGIKDLWGAIIDLNQEHYQTVDTTHVTLAADAESLTGVPTDTFRVLLIEPLDTTSSGSMRDVLFKPRKYNDPMFINARALGAQDPTSGLTIFYSVSSAGSPVAAPTVLTAPKISSALTLRFVYVPGIAAVAASGANPIPGESDHALINWVCAYARCKEREDRSPDPNFLAVYATEKQNLLVRMTPRQTQEPEVVDDFFGAWG
jgi:hypothetical protein